MALKLLITPVFLNEFNLWFKLGSKSIDKHRLIPITINKGGNLQLSEQNKGKFIASIPDFEDDFEILLVVLRDVEENTQKDADKKIHFKFRQIEMVMPITERGKKLLVGKIDSRIHLYQPQFEDIFTSIKIKLHENLSRMGGNSLLEIFDLNGDLDFSEYEKDISEALELREIHPGNLNPDRSLLFNAVAYDRNKPFSKNDIGFFFDIGSIILQLNLDKDEKMKFLQEYGDSLKGKKAGEDYKKIYHIINELETEGLISKLENLTGRNDFISSVLFLMLVSEQRQGGSIKNTKIIEIVEYEYLKMMHRRDVALAVWLTGFFWGFDNISDLYYEIIKPKALCDPSKLIVQEGVTNSDLLKPKRKKGKKDTADLQNQPKKKNKSVNKEGGDEVLL